VTCGSRKDAYFVLYYIRKVRKESVDNNTVSANKNVGASSHVNLVRLPLSNSV